jgi:hypothetical protein
MSQPTSIYTIQQGDMTNFQAIDIGFENRNDVQYNLIIEAGFTRIHPNMNVSNNITVTIEVGAELQVT